MYCSNGTNKKEKWLKIPVKSPGEQRPPSHPSDGPVVDNVQHVQVLKGIGHLNFNF